MERKYVKENRERKGNHFIFKHISEYSQFLNGNNILSSLYQGTVLNSPISDYAKEHYIKLGYVYIIIL